MTFVLLRYYHIVNWIVLFIKLWQYNWGVWGINYDDIMCLRVVLSIKNYFMQLF